MADSLIVWFEQLAGTQSTEVPQRLLDAFRVRTRTRIEEVERVVADESPAAIFFDFDYPDRARLNHFAALKARYPSIPALFVTLQHSESLAVWAFRHGALDYLVKPIPAAELESCIERLQRIQLAKADARRRANVRFARPPLPDTVPNVPRSKKERLAPAIFFVQQNYSQRISSDAMARACGMSASHFSRAFKKVYGLTFQEFLLRYRVFQACHFLNVSAANVSEIAWRVGFSDPSYFTRVFKRYVGVAPSEFPAANDADIGADLSADASAEEDASVSQIVRKISSSFGP